MPRNDSTFLADTYYFVVIYHYNVSLSLCDWSTSPFLFLFVCFVVCMSYLFVSVHNLVYMFWGLYMGLWPKCNKSSEVFLLPSPLPSLCTAFMWLVSVFPLCVLVLGFVWTLPTVSVFLSSSTQHLGGLSYSVSVFPFCEFFCVCICLALLLCGCVEVMCTQQCCVVSGPEHSSGPVWSPAQQVGQPWWGCGYWCCYPGKNQNMLFDLDQYVFVYPTVFTMPLVDNLMFTRSVLFDR